MRVSTCLEAVAVLAGIAGVAIAASAEYFGFNLAGASPAAAVLGIVSMAGLFGLAASLREL